MAGIVYLVGAGPGESGLLTVWGAECMASADVIVADAEVSARLIAKHAAPGAELILVGADDTAAVVHRTLIDRASDGRTVVRLTPGDADVNGTDSAALTAAGVDFEAVPGVIAAWFGGKKKREPRILLVSTKDEGRPPGVTIASPFSIVPRFADVKQILLKLDRYRIIAFTSAHTVDVVVAALTSSGRDSRALFGIKLAAVGASTARKLESYQLRADVVAAQGGDALALEILTCGLPGPVLLPRAVGGRDELVDRLRAGNLEVDVVDAYESIVDTRAIERALLEHRHDPFDAVAFSSPRGVKVFFEAVERSRLRPLFDHVRFGAIGETTQAELRNAGIDRSVVPDRPDSGAMIEDLKAALAAGTQIE